MPVRFEKASEYKQNYQGPFATPSERHAVAGLKSEELGIVFDPPIQRRKKTVFDKEAGGDDYMLLGDQAKFAPSVKYKLPHKERFHNEEVNTLQIPVGPVGKTRESCPVHGKHSTMSRQDKNPPKEDEPVENGDSVPSVERSPPPAPRVAEDESYKRKPSNYISRPTKPSMKGKPHAAPKKSHEPRPQPENKPVKKAAPVEPLIPATKAAPPTVTTKPTTKPPIKPGQYREKRQGQMNEFVQTDLTRGVADSGQEAPADYAMKYRAGIAPPRPRGPKRLSEYQLQFKWKDGLQPSPLLAAEQVVYNSNPHLAPYSNPAVMPKTTEYKAAFKKYAYKPVPIEKSEGTPAKKAKLQRSKSLEVIHKPESKEETKETGTESNSGEENARPVTPDRLRAAGVNTGKRSEEDKRLLRESQNPTRIFFPHGKVRNSASEYASNYQAPSHYQYEEGVWRGADPPHIQPAKNPIPVEVDYQPVYRSKEREAAVMSPTWYQEVMELRNKAAEYKMRARGTHFSRQHLAQLYAQQADLWDTVSNSSTLSALSLESAGAMNVKKVSKAAGKSSRESVTSSTDTTNSSPK